MSPLEKLFGKTAQLTVLEYLMNNKREINYLSGIAQATGLYHSSVARVIEPLLQNNIIIEKKIGFSDAREKIMIVDDEMSTLLPLKRSLEAQGYIVIEAYDGYQAIEKSKTEVP